MNSTITFKKWLVYVLFGLLLIVGSIVTWMSWKFFLSEGIFVIGMLTVVWGLYVKFESEKCGGDNTTIQ